MKIKPIKIKNRKVRYGSITVALTVVIIAAVVLFNVIFTSLAGKLLWYVDMTPDLLYTTSDACLQLIEETFTNVNEERAQTGENEAKVTIIFCDEPDNLNANETQRLVYSTARDLADKFPDSIEVVWYDIIKNPSAVQAYGSPKTTSVIITSGTEYLVYALRTFYTFSSSDDEEPWAYNAEKKFAAAIISVTQAESPIALLTNNHKETIYDSELVNLLTDAGYKVGTIDLAREEIPADCRLMITYHPTADFLVRDGVSEISEIETLDKFLDGANSYMIFTDADTPQLPNLEEYLAEWGIAYDRFVDEVSTSGETSEFNYMLKDTSQSLSIDGFTFVGEYETMGFGGSVTSEMRSAGVPKKVIFRNASSISASDYFTETYYHNEELEKTDTSEDYWYYTYYQNGVSRNMYNIFTTSAEAVAMANGKEAKKATSLDKFSLMTITREIRTIQESNYTTVDDASYVIACTSTEFATEAYLQSAVYGNSDLMLSTMRTVGREVVPVGITFTPFADTTISAITTSQANQYTVVLTVAPAVIMFGLGVFVIARRKYS